MIISIAIWIVTYQRWQKERQWTVNIKNYKLLAPEIEHN